MVSVRHQYVSLPPTSSDDQDKYYLITYHVGRYLLSMYGHATMKSPKDIVHLVA